MAILGWDISTSIVGLCVFSNDGKLLKHTHLDLRNVEGQLAKADAFFAWANPMINNEVENYHFIEERLGGFAGGRTSAQILMKLAQFNAICSYIIWTGGKANHRQVTYLHPSTWKSLMKKEGLIIPKGCKEKKVLTLEFVRRKEQTFSIELNRNDKPQPWSYDEADAYCIGRSGYHKLCIAKENLQE